MPNSQTNELKVLELRASEERSLTLSAQLEQQRDQATEFLNQTSVVLERLAARDLTACMQGDDQGYYAQIKLALNTAVDNLSEALAQVTAGAEQVTSAAGQINAGSQSLA